MPYLESHPKGVCLRECVVTLGSPSATLRLQPSESVREEGNKHVTVVIAKCGHVAFGGSGIALGGAWAAAFGVGSGGR